MKIGILSDTHIRYGKSLPNYVWDALEDVDMILHAGDILIEGILEDLEILAPVVAVRGNCDWELSDLPETTIVSAEKIKIGITHGHLGRGGSTPQRAYNLFQDQEVDIIVFGHSHIPYKEVYNGITLFNPGSPTDKRGQPAFSLGILTVRDEHFEIYHMFF